MKHSILIVDDEDTHRQMIDAVLSEKGYETHLTSDGQGAIAAVKKRFFDLIIMDIRMKKMDGVTALKRIKRINPSIPVIMMTAYASVGTAVDTLKAGAYDYLIKPIDIEELKLLVKRVLQHHQLKEENEFLKEQLNERFDHPHIIGSSRNMERLFEHMAMIAPTDTNVLIYGESGTGKELIASAIHQNSLRKEGPFIAVNCAAIPENLLESELFGHEKGAFTGAVRRKKGRFVRAQKGTLFLDEIAELPIALQAKILRTIQEREVEPLGGTHSTQIDVRILAATNKNLEIEINNENFREDLFYRINVVKIDVPPLRARSEDIPLLANYFLKVYAEKNHRLIKSFTPGAMDLLIRYEWPGNVRELQNIIERAVILSRGNLITLKELPRSLKKWD